MPYLARPLLSSMDRTRHQDEHRNFIHKQPVNWAVNDKTPVRAGAGGAYLAVDIVRQVWRVLLFLPASVRRGQLRQRVEAGNRPSARQESPFLQQRDALVGGQTTAEMRSSTICAIFQSPCVSGGGLLFRLEAASERASVAVVMLRRRIQPPFSPLKVSYRTSLIP